MTAFPLHGPVEIIAHRGYSARAPENTLAALDLAIEAGADALEFDVQTAFDGTPFLLHDATLERTTDGRGAIRDQAPAALEKLDAGAWFGTAFRGEPLPSLARATAHVRGRIGRLYPEVKAYRMLDDVERMVDVVAEAGWLPGAVFISMDWEALERIRAVCERALLGYIVERAERADAALERARKDERALLDFNGEVLLNDPGIADRVRRAGVPMAVWTVNQVDVAERLLAMGVDRITTNEVEALSRWRATL